MQYIYGQYTQNDNYIPYLTDRQSFMDLNYQGRRLYGGCTRSVETPVKSGPWLGTSSGPSWREFLLGPLQIDHVKFEVRSIEFLVAGYYDRLQNLTYLNPFAEPSFRVAACNHSVLANKLVEFIRVPSPVNATLSLVCPDIDYQLNSTWKSRLDNVTHSTYNNFEVNNTWVVKHCPSDVGAPYPGVCLNCTDPCSHKMHCNTTNLHTFDYHIAPCLASAECHEIQEPRIRFLSVLYGDKIAAPSIVEYFADTTGSSIALGLTLSEEGFAYCAAFTLQATPRVTSNFIITQSNLGSYTRNKQAYIKIDGLSSASTYNVFCVASTLNGIMQPFETVLKNQSYQLSTVCCRAITIELVSNVGFYNTISSNFVKMTFASTGPFPPNIRVFTNFVNTTNKIAFEPTFITQNKTLNINIADPARKKGAAIVQNLWPLSGIRPIPDIPTPTSYYFDLGASQVGWYILRVEMSEQTFNRSLIDPSYVPVGSIPFLGSSTFAVISPTYRTPAPQIMSAVFSNDGTYINVRFDVPTDRGGRVGMFRCNTVFSGKGMETALCQFASSTNLYVYVTDDKGVSPGETITAIRNNLIKPQCTGIQTIHGDCVVWPDVAIVVVTVQNAFNPAVPAVAVAGPETASPCTDVVLDLTASQGSGGRQFSSISCNVSVVQGDATQTLSAQSLQNYLQKRLAVDRLWPPPTFPASMMLPGVEYVLDIQLCNFMRKCGRAVKPITMMAPLFPAPMILGKATRQMYRSDALELRSVLPDFLCPLGDGASQSALQANLSYAWIVYEESTPMYRWKSYSKDKTLFKLKPYFLTVEKTYTFELTVSNLYTLRQSSARVKVFVMPSPLIVRIAGGDQQTLRINDQIRLDAGVTFSADRTKLPVLRDSLGVPKKIAPMLFQWSCKQVWPKGLGDDDTCEVRFSIDLITRKSITDRSFCIIKAQSSAAGNTVAQLTVSVLDYSGRVNKTGQASVLVQVLPYHEVAPDGIHYEQTIVGQPKMWITSGVQLVRQDPSADLTIQAAVAFKAITNSSEPVMGTAMWTVDDDDMDLAASALSDISRPVGLETLALMSLVVKGGTLRKGAALTFSLTCRMDNGDVATTSMVIHTNQPPSPGTFAVMAPDGGQFGYAFSTKFSYYAKNWVDIDGDLPIAFEFGFVQASGGYRVVLQSKSEMSYAALVLPGGAQGNRWYLTVYASVIDSLGAGTLTTALVQSQSNINPKNSVAIINQIKTLLAGAQIGSVDDQKQVLALASTLINIADCSQATSSTCAALNRGDCSQTANTCGSCLDSFVGDFGDGNSPCLSAGSPFPRIPKVCPNGCSGAGVCTFQTKATKKATATCFMDNPMCRAVCTCTTGLFGAACQYNATLMATKQGMRATMLSSLSDLIAQEDFSIAAWTGWSNSLAIIMLKPDEIANTQIAKIQTAARQLLSQAIANGWQYTQLQPALLVIDSSLQAADNVDLRISKTMQSYGSHHHRKLLDAAVQQTYANLKVFSDFVSSKLVSGQRPVEIATETYRMTIAPLPTHMAAVTANVLLPISAYESSSGKVPSTVTVAMAANYSRLAAALQIKSTAIQIPASLYGPAGANFYSSPVRLHFSNVPCDPINPTQKACSVDITLQHYDFIPIPRVPVPAVRTYCQFDDYSTHTVSCPDGTLVQVQCDGYFGSIVTECPYFKPVAHCATLSNFAGVLDGRPDVFTTNYTAYGAGCVFKSNTEYNVTCSCPIAAMLAYQNARRRLAVATGKAPTNAPVKYPRGTTSTSTFVAVPGLLAQSVRNTFSSVGKLNPKVVQVGWQVTTVMTVLLALLGGSLLWGHSADTLAKREKSLAKVKPAKQEAEVAEVAEVDPSQEVSPMSSPGGKGSPSPKSAKSSPSSSPSSKLGGTWPRLPFSGLASPARAGGATTSQQSEGGSSSGAIIARSDSVESLSDLRKPALTQVEASPPGHSRSRPRADSDGGNSTGSDTNSYTDSDDSNRSLNARFYQSLRGYAARLLVALGVRSKRVQSSPDGDLGKSKDAKEEEKEDEDEEPQGIVSRLLGDKKKRADKAAIETAARLRAYQDRKTETGFEAEVRAVEQTLPKVMHEKPLWQKIVSEAKAYHRWLGIVYTYCPHAPRVIRIASLATQVITMNFVQAITYQVTSPDDGSCELLPTQSECLLPTSAFRTGDPKCYWDHGFRRGSCHFLEPVSSLLIVFYVAFFAAVVSAPFIALVEYLLLEVLTAPTKEAELNRYLYQLPLLRRLELFFRRTFTSTVTPSASSDVAPDADPLDRTGKFERDDLARKKAIMKRQLETMQSAGDIKALTDELQDYRSHLSRVQKGVFDKVWGLEERGFFDERLGRSNLFLLASGGRRENVMTAIIEDVTNVRRAVEEEEREWFGRDDVPDRAKGERLMHLFQKDLLPGLHGKIIERKRERDNGRRLVPRSWQLKLTCWAFIAGANLGMMLYIYVFAVMQNLARQQAWLNSLFIYLIIDVVLVSTCSVIFHHVAIPAVVMRDVSDLKAKLANILRDYTDVIRAKMLEAQRRKGVPDTVSEFAEPRLMREAAVVDHESMRLGLPYESSVEVAAQEAAEQKRATVKSRFHLAASKAMAETKGGPAEVGDKTSVSFTKMVADAMAKSEKTSSLEVIRGMSAVSSESRGAAGGGKGRGGLMDTLSRATRQAKYDDPFGKVVNGKHSPPNAAKYLFASFRLAQNHPELEEAQLIRRFSTPYPPRSYKYKKSDLKETYSNRCGAVSKVLTSGLTLMVGMLLVMPNPVQDNLSLAGLHALLSYVLLMHMYLWRMHPFLAFVPALLLAAVVYFMAPKWSNKVHVAIAREMASDAVGKGQAVGLGRGCRVAHYDESDSTSALHRPRRGSYQLPAAGAGSPAGGESPRFSPTNRIVHRHGQSNDTPQSSPAPSPRANRGSDTDGSSAEASPSSTPRSGRVRLLSPEQLQRRLERQKWLDDHAELLKTTAAQNASNVAKIKVVRAHHRRVAGQGFGARRPLTSLEEDVDYSASEYSSDQPHLDRGSTPGSAASSPSTKFLPFALQQPGGGYDEDSEVGPFDSGKGGAATPPAPTLSLHSLSSLSLTDFLAARSRTRLDDELASVDSLDRLPQPSLAGSVKSTRSVGGGGGGGRVGGTPRPSLSRANSLSSKGNSDASDGGWDSDASEPGLSARRSQTRQSGSGGDAFAPAGRRLEPGFGASSAKVDAASTSGGDAPPSLPSTSALPPALPPIKALSLDSPRSARLSSLSLAPPEPYANDDDVAAETSIYMGSPDSNGSPRLPDKDWRITSDSEGEESSSSPSLPRTEHVGGLGALLGLVPPPARPQDAHISSAAAATSAAAGVDEGDDDDGDSDGASSDSSEGIVQSSRPTFGQLPRLAEPPANPNSRSGKASPRSTRGAEENI